MRPTPSGGGCSRVFFQSRRVLTVAQVAERGRPTELPAYALSLVSSDKCNHLFPPHYQLALGTRWIASGPVLRIPPTASAKWDARVNIRRSQEIQRGSAPDRRARGRRTPPWRPVLATPVICRCRRGLLAPRSIARPIVPATSISRAATCGEVCDPIIAKRVSSRQFLFPTARLQLWESTIHTTHPDAANTTGTHLHGAGGRTTAVRSMDAATRSRPASPSGFSAEPARQTVATEAP